MNSAQARIKKISNYRSIKNKYIYSIKYHRHKYTLENILPLSSLLSYSFDSKQNIKQFEIKVVQIITSLVISLNNWFLFEYQSI